MSRLVEMFRSLPRAGRWGVIAIAAFAGYFLIVEPVLELTNTHDAAADAIENSLRRTAELASDDSDDGRMFSSGINAYGHPQLPNDPKTRPEAIQRVVDEVLETHGIETRTKTERNSTLTGDKARALVGSDKLERYIVEVSFEADQNTVAQIIADLEQSPVVSAVSRVKIDRTAIGSRYFDDADKAVPGRVRATISAESWVQVRATPGAASTGEPS